MRRNTIKQVTRNLDPSTKEALRALWDEVGLMDLDYSSLADYINCMRQRHHALQLELKEKESLLHCIAKIARK